MLLIGGLKTAKTHLFNPTGDGAALCGEDLPPAVACRPFYPLRAVADVSCSTCLTHYLGQHDPTETHLQPPPPFWRNQPKNFIPTQGNLF